MSDKVFNVEFKGISPTNLKVSIANVSMDEALTALARGCVETCRVISNTEDVEFEEVVCSLMAYILFNAAEEDDEDAKNKDD